GAFDNSTGTLTLSGSASVANYQAALRSVTYRNTSDNPSTANRTVTFTATDGSYASAAVTKTLTVTAANDAPVITLPGAAVNYIENDPATVLDSGATVTDADSANFDTGTLTVDFTAGGSADDRLEIRNEGAGS